MRPGELYPTDVRTSAHGFSAGTAKMGALWASVWFNYLDGRTKFWLTSSFNIGGLLLTLLFMPDPLRVSLTEVDRRWSYLTSGRVYHGEAISPKNLSMFERLIGIGKVRPSCATLHPLSAAQTCVCKQCPTIRGPGPAGSKMLTPSFLGQVSGVVLSVKHKCAQI